MGVSIVTVCDYSQPLVDYRIIAQVGLLCGLYTYMRGITKRRTGPENRTENGMENGMETLTAFLRAH